MAQRHKKASSKPRSQSPRQREETLRQLLTRERALRKQALAREKEALERQAATSDILKVISGSPTDVARVFDAIAERARVLCEASFAYTTRFDGRLLHLVGYRGASAQAEAVMREMFPRRPDPGSSSGRAILAGEPVQIPDVHLDPQYQLHVQAKAAEYRSMLAVPMLRGGEPIGAVGVARKEPGAFSDRLVSLLKIFADQAVIAIENARLFNETKEALEQQTASSEILRVISSSPTDLAPVFDAILRSATRLCDAHLGVLNLYDGDRFRTVAQQGGTPEFAKWAYARGAWKPAPTTTLGRMTVAPEPLQVADIKEAPAYRARVETAVNFVELAGARSLLSVPLLRNQELLGAFSIYRAEVRPFTDKQIALLKAFADQAVIAIENVRLFNETKEALERQIATSDILRVISQSPRDVQPAFDTIARAALKLCRAGSAYACTFDGELIHLVGFANVRPEGADQLRQVFPRRPSRETTLARAVLTRSVVEIPDVHEDPDYAIHAAARASDYRSVLAVPLLRGALPIGAIAVARQQAGRFPDKQIALLQTFADQAVIAIENVRLFNETTEALEQQKASADILRVIASSPSDTQPVFDAIAKSGVRLFQGVSVSVRLAKGDRNERVAFAAGPGSGVTDDSSGSSIPLKDELISSRSMLRREVVHVPDIMAEDWIGEESKRMAERMGYRAVAVAPMVRDGDVLGIIGVTRAQAGPFNERDLALLKTFADQAVIAIQNVQLFNETKEALERQTATADILKVISRFDTDLQPVFDAIAANALELCRATTGWVYRFDGHLIHIASAHGLRPEALEVLRRDYPMRPSRGAATARAILTCAVVYIANIRNDVEYALRDLAGAAAYRSVLSVPMLLEGKPIGAITVTGADADAFTERQIELLQTFAEQAVIAIQNAHLFREIREKSVQLQAVNSQLELASKHKSEFLANMSHELRTPLNAIIGFSEALMDRMFGDLNEKQVEYQKDIHESGKHLLSLINDILDLSKIEAGKMELELSTFHLPTAVSNAVTLIRERAMRHGIDLGIEIDERLGDFQGDERKVKQVLLNLLSNAVKFTPDGGRVDVSAKLDTDKVEIAVKDTGVGIATEDQASLFEEFKQLGKDGSRKAEGTGLGLALTKRLVELHGGQILVDSAVGKGSTFRVLLPARV